MRAFWPTISPGNGDCHVLTLAEIQRGLVASWDLFCGRDRGLAALPRDETGFWRSFLVFPLLLPFYVIFWSAQRSSILSAPDMSDAPVPLVSYLIWEMLGAIADWVVPPLVLAAVARPLGISGVLVRYIVARNWTSVLSVAIATAPFLVALILPVHDLIVAIAMIVTWAIILRYQFIVARMALASGTLMAVAVVLMELVISVGIAHAVSTMIGR
jgi:hypothetical protein